MPCVRLHKVRLVWGRRRCKADALCANASCCWVAGYVQRDYSVGVLLKDLGKVLTVSYAHNIDPTSSVGAEVTKKLEEKEATVFALGCAQPQGVVGVGVWQRRLVELL